MKTDYELLRDRVAHRYGIDRRDVDWLRLHAGATDIYNALKALLAFYEPDAAQYLDSDAWKRAHAQALRSVANYNGPLVARCDHEYGQPIGKPRMAQCRKCGAWQEFTESHHPACDPGWGPRNYRCHPDCKVGSASEEIIEIDEDGKVHGNVRGPLREE